MGKKLSDLSKLEKLSILLDAFYLGQEMPGQNHKRICLWWLNKHNISITIIQRVYILSHELNMTWTFFPSFFMTSLTKHMKNMPFFIHDFLFLSQFLNVINAITMDFQDILNASIQELKDDTDITDVTLACNDHSIKAHKVILSACTPWFENLDKWLYQR